MLMPAFYKSSGGIGLVIPLRRTFPKRASRNVCCSVGWESRDGQRVANHSQVAYEKCQELCTHGGRKTVTEKDMRLLKRLDRVPRL